MELICYFLIQIWRSNIKRDIKKQFKLEKNAENKGYDSCGSPDQYENDDENAPFLYNADN